MSVLITKPKECPECARNIGEKRKRSIQGPLDLASNEGSGIRDSRPVLAASHPSLGSEFLAKRLLAGWGKPTKGSFICFAGL